MGDGDTSGHTPSLARLLPKTTSTPLTGSDGRTPIITSPLPIQIAKQLCSMEWTYM